jgi:hypothetical protein
MKTLRDPSSTLRRALSERQLNFRNIRFIFFANFEMSDEREGRQSAIAFLVTSPVRYCRFALKVTADFSNLDGQRLECFHRSVYTQGFHACN